MWQGIVATLRGYIIPEAQARQTQRTHLVTGPRLSGWTVTAARCRWQHDCRRGLPVESVVRETGDEGEGRWGRRGCQWSPSPDPLLKHTQCQPSGPVCVSNTSHSLFSTTTNSNTGTVPVGSYTWGTVPVGSCPRWELSQLGAVPGELSQMGAVPHGNCPRWELSQMGIVQLGALPGELSQMGTVPVGSYTWGTVPDGSCPTWELSQLGAVLGKLS